MRGMSTTRTIAIASVCAAVGAAGGIAGVSAATGDDASGGSGNSGGSAGVDQRTGNGDGPGRHVGANGEREQPLSGDVAAKVREAALAKVDGGTIERVETDADHGSPYEAHVRRSDGTELEVLVNESFSVTAVNEMQHP
jgi:hypothetical protein